MSPTLHLIFKTHLDLGFTGYASAVRAQYHDYFIPMALDTGEHFLRENAGAPQFIWTTGSWLIWDHLETQPPEKVKRLERAIENGIIRWHGLPFTTHTELMSPALLAEGLSISRELDARFGVKTRAAKMTDVPGHTLGMIPLLAQAGIDFLHIGVNSASTPPAVPPVFRWRAPSGEEITVMYQSEYGTTFVPQGMDDGIAFAHTMDNMGPQNVGHVVDSFYQLGEANPGFEIKASTLDAFAAALAPHKEGFPVVTEEIADSWIHGAGSAPRRMSRFLAARRAFDGFAKDAPTPERRAFGRKLLEVAEHTWGVDIKVYLRDETAWDRTDFEAARTADPRFAITEGAWAEQDAIVDEALACLGDEDRSAVETPPQIERITGGGPITAQHDYAIGGWTLQFDPDTGALRRAARDGKAVATALDGGPGLFGFTYESYDAGDMDAYKDSYLTARYRWGIQDHGKPGLENAVTAVSRRFSASHARIATTDGAITVIADGDPHAVDTLGAPATIQTTYTVEGDALSVSVALLDKPANRMPEAGFITFAAKADPESWRLGKLGFEIDPLSVIANGNRQLHAVDRITARSSGGGFALETLDAPLFVPGGQPFLIFARDLPDMAKGGRFAVFNNKWGTNFSMWCEGDFVFRFVLTPTGG
ncbi:DUF5054 domain-containing protein [Pelagibacterium xiamenense]|uniref:DUF5054 domain-containing protein n=1 Tax=Pelagibacterium xiamenense TaxID=2901140 RepID=UPI001E65CE19|nr:DUF5054 domain-containing protein [Pelagibacterium xiamenense]MCD7059795.1 DUF5054 domain-containing protein [Pelagibacterium xiamenense]